MLADPPILTIYDKTGRRLDHLRAPVAVKVTPRWWDTGTAEVTVQAADARAAMLRTPGARIQIDLRGEHLLGGPVTGWSVDGPPTQEWAFRVTDDADLLNRVMCWPSPDKPLDQQRPDPDQRTGKLESVVKSLIAANAPLTGIPVDIATDQGRGPQVTLTARWQPLGEVIGGALRAAGMAVVARWRPETNRVEVDVAETRPYNIELSPETRTVTQYSLDMDAPAATRVILGPAEGTVFQQAANSKAEEEWGPFLRGSRYASATNTDEATTAGTEALNDGNARSGMAISLSESGLVRYGGPNGLHVGDTATIRLGDTTITDVVREVTVEWAPGKPLTVTPAVGGWDSSPVFALADAVRRTAAQLRRGLNR